VSESIFLAEGEFFVPTEHARGPWDAGALHGGAPAGLIAAALERFEPGAQLSVARLGFEFLRPVPSQPLTIAIAIARGGRRVQELAAELRAGEQLVCRASALRVQPVPDGLPAVGAGPDAVPMPPPQQGEAVRFSLDDSDTASFAASAMEMRFLDPPGTSGAARVWMRLRAPFLPGQRPSALARLAATADFGNGVGAALPFERFLFINADLHIHLHRLPRGEWIGLDARTHIEAGGTGLAESVLHDLHGPVGRSFQSLVVGTR
jgi:Acyl-CoA thioesterase C-terminal domain/Acyl-CoA thioesterase N-terminal domain